MTIKVPLPLQSEALPWEGRGGGGCWTDEPHKSNLFRTGEPKRGGEVREGKELMRGLKMEAAPPSSVLFGCVLRL